MRVLLVWRSLGEFGVGLGDIGIMKLLGLYKGR